MTRWLVFLDGCYPAAWLRLEAGVVATRGADLASLPAEAALSSDVVAVVPGIDVVVHWVQLPALAPAQAAAAARLLGADVCAAAVETTHIAIGAIGADSTRPLALVDSAVMAGWEASLAGAGISADAIVPLPLLVPTTETNAPVKLVVGDVANVHGDSLAFAGEAPMVDLMLGGGAVAIVDTDMFEAALPSMLATVPLNLRQGAFAARQAPVLDPQRRRRIGAMALAAAGLWLATEVAALRRDASAADRIEAQVADAARAVLPRGTAIDAPRAQVAARAERLGAAGHGFAALAAPLLVAVRDRPGASLQTLRYSPDAGLAAAVILRSPADRQGLVEAFSGADVAVTIGAARDDGGKPIVDIGLRPR